MRVLFLLTSSLDDPAGFGRYYPLARQMVQLGHAVEIAALNPAWSTLGERAFVRDGVTVSYVAQMHVYAPDPNRRQYFNTPQLLRVTFLATLALARVALTHPADAIHICKAQPMNGLAGWLGALLRRRRLYLDCDDDETASNRFASDWQRGIVRWWEDRLPHAARGITVNTTFLRDRLVHSGISAGRIRFVPNGFDPERLCPPQAGQMDQVRRRWGLDSREVVLYLGSLNLANHPLLLLLDAMVLVKQRLPSAVLLLVGGGEAYDRIAQEIQARHLQGWVVLTGHVDPAAVAPFYAASRLSIDPVDDDDIARARNPLKIVESLAMGVPVVTGRIGDRAAMLGNGSAGVLVEPGNPQALADGIVSALTDRARYDRMAEQARSIAGAYKWDCLAREFVKIYDM